MMHSISAHVVSTSLGLQLCKSACMQRITCKLYTLYSVQPHSATSARHMHGDV